MSRKTEPDATPYFDLPCACATARRTARLLTQMYDRHLRAHGIEGTQFALLEALEGLGPRSQAAVGLGFGLEKTTLSRNLRVLARKGWVEATAGADSRERLYQLTPAGRKTLQAARPAWRRAQTDLRTRLGPAQWEAMWRAFRAVTEIAGGPSTRNRDSARA